MSIEKARQDVKIQIYDTFRELFRKNKELEDKISVKESELNNLKDKHRSQIAIIEVSCEQFGFEIKKVDAGLGVVREELMPSEEIEIILKRKLKDNSSTYLN